VSKSPGAGRPESLRPLFGAVILLFITLLAFASLKGYRDLTAARARERQLTNRIGETRASIERLRGRIERLKSDPATLERVAREELGMVSPRDVVIELPVANLESLAGSGLSPVSPVPQADRPAAAPPPRPSPLLNGVPMRPPATLPGAPTATVSMPQKATPVGPPVPPPLASGRAPSASTTPPPPVFR
jgi:cell division protein FtsB